MINNIKCLGHSSIRINNDKIIYMDPYNIKENNNDADIIFITHSHYDHFSKEDINKIKKDNTIIVVTEDIYNNVLELGFNESNIIKVLSNNNYSIDNIKFNTIPSYNINKNFHLLVNNWVGYLIEINDIKYYIPGDTDLTNESKNVECDILFVPIGGTYTMNYEEAASLTNTIKPKIVIPIHYGSIVGNKEDAYRFKELIDKDIECKIML